MNTRVMLIGATAGLLLAAAGAPARAEVRLMVDPYGNPYFAAEEPPPVYVPVGHRKRYLPPPDPYDSGNSGDGLYGGSPDGPVFDESYYDPYYLPPSKKPAKKPVVTTAKPKVPVAAKATAGGGMSCDKAQKIVSGYGFTGISSKVCQGQVYEFNATRDGKTFLIKMSAASGELTEVKKTN